MKVTPCVLSVADHAGWAHIVCVAAPGDVPAVVERRRVTLIDAGLPTLPYHHESIGMREDDANVLIARVRRSIAERTSDALRGVVNDLAPAYPVVALAIREPPFAKLPETVAPVRQSYRLQCAADGMMYQLAVCHAARDLGLDVHLCRRGEETARAAARLAVRVDDMESFVSGTGRPSGPPWTEEHRRHRGARGARTSSPQDSDAVMAAFACECERRSRRNSKSVGTQPLMQSSGGGLVYVVVSLLDAGVASSSPAYCRQLAALPALHMDSYADCTLPFATERARRW
jgi:hypothetical protein